MKKKNERKTLKTGKNGEQLKEKEKITKYFTIQINKKYKQKIIKKCEKSRKMPKIWGNKKNSWRK